MNLKIKKSLFALIAIFYSAISFAGVWDMDEDPAYYAGITGGTAKAGFTGLNNQAPSSIGLLFGAQMNDRLAFEFGGKQASYSNAAAQNASMSTYSGVAIIGKQLKNSSVRIGARFGYAMTTVDIASVPANAAAVPAAALIPAQSSTTSGPTYGALFEYAFDDVMSLRASVDIFKASTMTGTAAGAVVTTAADSGNITDTSIGLLYKF